MNKDLQAEIDNWRADYLHLGREMGEIVNEQQDKIISLSQENKRLKREIWNLRKTKRRK
ncbi:2-hydroxyacyl-CoA dehydratase [Streptococcus constellatus]|uniref:2-hydroxyacyl-CoA dehydratase n=1 Tax=Streptococcus constellatus TaxID=76860 RepID=UPI00118251C3|nr:2-hydroxyacyl-CoA dehydratase [Streptococcus constellatus]